MGDRWRVEVDRSVCIGSGMCIGSAPADFKLDAGRQSHPRAEEMDASDEILEAAESCPVEAISIIEVATGKTVFPPD
ncbi:ferredoxin [Streptomyces sp. SID3343]|uniref:ferredoxin n=1 Tax=Streptomyces sp. SID3343 TaxID=2690260 RepID=UPI00136A95FC|nr:ferredoxin [Streptomyces sp. SID3343]MYW05143.1 ferredoxin [Streptomyces sp. SID3343]